MRVVSIDQTTKTPVSAKIFTGPNVTRQDLLPESAEFGISIINFGLGVKNKLHAQDGEQILLITGGVGIVATENEEHEVKVGDIVYVPAGEKHWHGAKPEGFTVG